MTEAPHLSNALTRLVLGGLLALVALVRPAAAQAPAEPEVFGELIDVRTGFVRVTLPAGAPPPRAEDIEVLWRKQPQKVLRVLGGAGDSIEVGILVDRSASMFDSFEPMRAATLDLVGRAISDSDRLFAVAFTDEARLIAEGRGNAATVIAKLPAQPETGTHATALFSAIERALQLFENADARAALLVVSDGCDTAGGATTATSAARHARDRAIPIFLLLPSRSDCQNTVCTQDVAGQWHCKAEASPVVISGASNEMFNPAARQSGMNQSAAAGGATAERDRFTGLINVGGGGDFVVNDPNDWPKALKKIFDLLGRQWTVVFEPSSDQVTSEEVRVYSTAGGRKKRLE